MIALGRKENGRAATIGGSSRCWLSSESVLAKDLETAYEELQSTNEELQTINEELRQRGDDLNRSNGFMESILTGMRSGVVVLDRELHVVAWNPRAEDLWGRQPTGAAEPSSAASPPAP